MMGLEIWHRGLLAFLAPKVLLSKARCQCPLSWVSPDPQATVVTKPPSSVRGTRNSPELAFYLQRRFATRLEVSMPDWWHLPRGCCLPSQLAPAILWPRGLADVCRIAKALTPPPHSQPAPRCGFALFAFWFLRVSSTCCYAAATAKRVPPFRAGTPGRGLPAAAYVRQLVPGTEEGRGRDWRGGEREEGAGRGRWISKQASERKEGAELASGVWR